MKVQQPPNIPTNPAKNAIRSLEENPTRELSGIIRQQPLEACTSGTPKMKRGLKAVKLTKQSSRLIKVSASETERSLPGR